MARFKTVHTLLQSYYGEIVLKFLFQNKRYTLVVVSGRIVQLSVLIPSGIGIFNEIISFSNSTYTYAHKQLGLIFLNHFVPNITHFLSKKELFL